MKKFLIPFIIILLLSICSEAKVVRDYASELSGNNVSFQIDSIDYRPDLTRVYGIIKGRPHTSGRIDNATLTVQSTTVTSTDIDGIDFHRYFQFEDDGVIFIEIDFPAIKPFDEANILFMTANGMSTTIVKRKSSNRR